MMRHVHDVIMILRHSDQQTNRYHDHLCTVHTIYFLHLSTDCTIMDFHSSSGEPKDDPVTTVVSSVLFDILLVCLFVSLFWVLFAVLRYRVSVYTILHNISFK